MDKIKSLKELEKWFEDMGATKETEDGITYFELTPANMKKKKEKDNGDN